MPQCPDFIHFGDAEDPLTPIVSTARALDDDTVTQIAALLGVTPAELQEALCRSHTSNGTIIAQHLAVAPRALYAALQDDPDPIHHADDRHPHLRLVK